MVDGKMDSCLRRNDNVIQLSGIGEENKAQPGAAMPHAHSSVGMASDFGGSAFIASLRDA